MGPTVCSVACVGRSRLRRRNPCSAHEEVPELPRVAAIDVLLEQPAAVLQRRPGAEGADQLPQVGPAQGQDPVEGQVFGLDHTAPRVLQRQATPAITAAVTCRLVALLYGASARACPIDRFEPYQ